MTMTLTRDEAIEILEDIARNSQNAAARIAAIKQLLEEMRYREETAGSEAWDDFDRRFPGLRP